MRCSSDNFAILGADMAADREVRGRERRRREEGVERRAAIAWGRREIGGEVK